MNKNTNNTNSTNEAILVPKSEMINILLGTVQLARMHLRLIDLHEEESRLKKRHQAYLHVRDYADQICEEDKEQVASIIDSIFPDVNLRDPKSVIPIETAAYFDPDLCQDCPGFDGCKEYMDSAAHVKTADEHVDDDDDERLILVSTDTMDDMLEDMCSLGMAVDDLLDIFYTLMDGGDISSDDLMERMYHAEDTSEEVYAKWGDIVPSLNE